MKWVLIVSATLLVLALGLLSGLLPGRLEEALRGSLELGSAMSEGEKPVVPSMSDIFDGGVSMRLQHVAINGHEVAYRTAGDGPVVLLVHGMAGSSATWNHVMPGLARRFTVVAPDLLGHGESAKPRAEYSLGAHADILRDLLNALGHDRATFVGQSFGGGVVMQLAYQFPERCERLVLVDSGGLGREVIFLLRALDRDRRRAGPPARLRAGVASGRGAGWPPGSAVSGFGRRRPARRSGGAMPRWPTPTRAGRSSALCAP